MKIIQQDDTVFRRKLYLTVLYINLPDNHEDNDDYGDHNKQEPPNTRSYCRHHRKLVSCQGLWSKNINIEFLTTPSIKLT